MLQIKDLHFSVDEDGTNKEIIKGIDLTVDDGKFVVITGPNGSGKSTLAKLIAGIEKPSSGEIIFNDENITDKSITDRANAGISFAFQQPVRFKGITVLDLLRLAAKKRLSVTPTNNHLLLKPDTEYYIVMKEGFVTFADGTKSPAIRKGDWTFATKVELDPYNLGDETYSFDNYSDKDSNGYCFGMSVTSAGYHIGALDIGAIGGNANTALYSFANTKTVKKPIRTYQAIQGSYRDDSTVAGGSSYLNDTYDIASDWQAVVDYVKDHKYDERGTLQIGFRKKGEGGHAINFLRYENINGQDRIYAYDNNFPELEVYFYQDAAGRVWERGNTEIHPEQYQTFSGAIDCIALRDCETYFGLVKKYNSAHALYMREGDAIVQSVTGKEYSYSYMECAFPGKESEEYVMYEIPEDQDRVVIISQREDASFAYITSGNVEDGFEYSEYKLGENDICVFKLASGAGAGDQTFLDPDFLVDDPANEYYYYAKLNFRDVANGAYYYDAVKWAVENGITTGKTATEFDPNGGVTRAQAVTFLWRAAGCPRVNYFMKFTDLKSGAYYTEAVRWAVAMGITKGVDETHFAPDATCTRAQIMSFLYRFSKLKVHPSNNPFTDVAEGAYYYDAVLWAVANGITGGKTATTFAPNDTCTRAQVVSFLYRYMGK